MVRWTGSVIGMILTAVLSAIFLRDPVRLAAAPEATTFTELQRRAESGDPEAEFNLGIAYDLGHLVRQDFAAAATWYRKAAEQGYPPAEFNLGAMYDNGRGVPQDRRLAASWYRRAALHGHGRAQFDLGQMYEHGDGVPRSTQQARHWYRLAARHGIPAALDKLAALTPPAPSPATPPQTAPPATSPDTAALAREEYQRGLDYWRGHGVDPDSAAAFDWFSRAAAHGNPQAAYVLGYLDEHGDGTAQNLIEAYAWYRLAATRLPPSKTRDAALISADRIAGMLSTSAASAAEDRYDALRSQVHSNTTTK
jgi:TPR repeat protein